MRSPLLVLIGLALLLAAFAGAAQAQQAEVKYGYRMDLTGADEKPVLFGFPEFRLPEAARENGVEGEVQAVLTLGADGTVSDIEITQSLPDGVDEAVIAGLSKLRFSPAKSNGEPVAVKMFFNYRITVIYSEGAENVTKPVILDQPDPVYPPDHKDVAGDVSVTIICYADGTLRVLNVISGMPKEFGQAATEAAKQIKFEPAQKDEKPVSQQLTIRYHFGSGISDLGFNS